MIDEILDLDGLAQAEHVRAGDVSPAELLEASIARIERENPTLNAVIHPLFDKARAQVEAGTIGDGPYRGVPFLVKDAVCQTEGDPYHVGMRVLKEAGYTAPVDTELARRFRAAGFVFVGKTNTPELACSATTEPLAYGASRNPWHVDYSTGGSSGGSAAAVAARHVAAAHGNDMGGSIRMPASHCGLVGLKPTRARNSLGPELGEFWGPLTHEHVLTRSVRDCAAILDATAGPAPGDPYTAPPPLRPWREEVGADPGRMRVGLVEPIPGLEVDPACLAAVDATAKVLEARGHVVEKIDLPPLAELEIGPWFMIAVARELDRVAGWIGRPIVEEDVEPYTWLLAGLGRRLTGTDVARLSDAMWAWARRLCEAWYAKHDVLLMPVTPSPAPKLGVLAPDAGPHVPGELARYTRYTMPFDITGEPAISLPVHVTGDGLPVGAQLVAKLGREDVLFRLAAQVDEVLGFEARRPPALA